MQPTHLTNDEVNFLTDLADEAERKYHTGRADKLRAIINQHSEPVACGSRFPFAGLQGGCDRPAGHKQETHRWTRPEDGWRVFWDDIRPTT